MTAEEFLKTTDVGRISLNGINFYPKESLEKAMIEFAKYHVEQALKEASKKASIIDESIGGGLNIEIKSIDKDSILNAYTLENIK